jgi:disulfide bond formation protein DsbB
MSILKGLALGLVGFFLFLVSLFLGIAISINATVLNPQFIVDEINKLDITAFTHEVILERVPSDFQDYVPEIDATLEEIKPWINQQTEEVVFKVYDYLLGETDDINILISTDAVKQTMVNRLTDVYLQSPPPEYQSLSEDQKNELVAEFQRSMEESIPPSFEFNKSDLGPEVEAALQQAREIIGYVKSAYLWLIIAAVVLILLIVLILRDIKGITRSTGIIFLVVGIISTILVFVGKAVFPC